jgi:hypothetical protein
VEKSNAYKAPGAVIEGVPATWVFPEIGLLSALATMTLFTPPLATLQPGH